MILGLGVLLFMPALLVLAALAGAFPGGVLRVAGGALIGLVFFGMLLGFSMRSRRAARVHHEIGLRGPPAEAIKIRPAVPPRAR